MAYTVYCHSNKENGKRYVGITKLHPSKRWNKGRGYISHPKFNNAITKHGWDGFTHFIIADGLTKEEACEMEIEFIDKWRCTENEFGYNSTTGGEYGTHTQETIAKISETKKGHTVSKETRERISKSLTGRLHPISDETRAKISKANKGKKHPFEVRQLRMKRVVCVETGEEFDWAKDAADSIGLKGYSNIAMCCRGERNTCGGFHWKYVEKEGDN